MGLGVRVRVSTEVRGDELLELGAAERELEVLGPAGVGRDERQ